MLIDFWKCGNPEATNAPEWWKYEQVNELVHYQTEGEGALWVEIGRRKSIRIWG